MPILCSICTTWSHSAKQWRGASLYSHLEKGSKSIARKNGNCYLMRMIKVGIDHAGFYILGVKIWCYLKFAFMSKNRFKEGPIKRRFGKFPRLRTWVDLAEKSITVSSDDRS